MDPTHQPPAGETFEIVLTDCWRDSPPTGRRLARLLKAAKRAYGFRCVAVAPVTAAAPAPVPPASPAASPAAGAAAPPPKG